MVLSGLMLVLYAGFVFSLGFCDVHLVLLCILSSLTIISMRNRELEALFIAFLYVQCR